MNTIINMIEDAIGCIVNNKDLIIGGAIVATVLGVIMGLIMALVFA